MINPNNAKPIKNKDGDLVVPPFVSVNYAKFMILYQSISMISLLLPSIFVSNPIQYQGNFISTLKKLYKRQPLDNTLIDLSAFNSLNLTVNFDRSIQLEEVSQIVTEN